MTGSSGFPGWAKVGTGKDSSGDEPVIASLSMKAYGNRRRWVVLDRDGTIIEEKHYLSDPGDVELIPGAAKGLRQLREMDLGLVVITNQSGIGRGYFDGARLDLIHQRVSELLALEEVYLDGFYHCPHLPEDNCLCRKPRTGLLELAAKDLDFDPQAALVIGDKASDVEMGQRVGATTLLVRTGYGAEVERDGKSWLRQPRSSRG